MNTKHHRLWFSPALPSQLLNIHSNESPASGLTYNFFSLNSEQFVTRGFPSLLPVFTFPVPVLRANCEWIFVTLTATFLFQNDSFYNTPIQKVMQKTLILHTVHQRFSLIHVTQWVIKSPAVKKTQSITGLRPKPALSFLPPVSPPPPPISL